MWTRHVEPVLGRSSLPSIRTRDVSLMLTGMAKARHGKNSIAHTKESMFLVKEYNNIAGAKPITAEELKDEQGNSTLSLPGTFETDQQLSVTYGNSLEYSLHEDYYNTNIFTLKAMALTPESANEIAKKYILPSHLVWVVVGDMAKVSTSSMPGRTVVSNYLLAAAFVSTKNLVATTLSMTTQTIVSSVITLILSMR